MISSELPPSADLIGESLRRIRPTDTLYSRAELTAPWGIEVPHLTGGMMLYVVTHGYCWLEVDGDEPRLLQRGSIALMPHGTSHLLRSSRDVMTRHLHEIPAEHVTPRYELIQYGGGGELVHITYGGVRFDHHSNLRLIEMLPLVIQIDSWDEDDSWVQNIVRMISREAREQRPGGETVIMRLVEVLVIQSIRSWIDTSSESERGWLAAMRDDWLSPALGVMHREPERNWTLSKLAAIAGLSRSAFAARFTGMTGDTPMAYLTRVRMELAHSELLESSEPLHVIAEKIGYASEATFSRAFKREFGISPGAARRSGRNERTESRDRRT